MKRRSADPSGAPPERAGFVRHPHPPSSSPAGDETRSQLFVLGLQAWSDAHSLLVLQVVRQAPVAGLQR
jgi:hypothetical protein